MLPRIIYHPNGQTTHCLDDDFTDPWKASEIIVIQHGFGRHAGFWYHWVPALSRQYRVIRRDTRGHGRSSFPKTYTTNDRGAGAESYQYTLDTILGEIIDTLDQLGLERVHFLGESTSGMLGIALAAKYPERLHSLTICSSPTFLPSAVLKLFAFGHSSWPDACRVLGSRGWANELSKIPGTAPVHDPAYMAWWTDQVAVSDGEGLAGYAEFLSSLDARPFLDNVQVPTLILAPANSAATKVEEQKAVSGRIHGSKLVIVDAPGHEIYVEQAELCQKELLQFLSGLK
ncbi:alpha/beta-hydrolase [Rhizodiscina lignyota]|uniref:Alpha/beta-hydrolase n=1 Tax=Rhizodiscina lignyota TaxID=1504668 RepID=A0A9P4M7B1_9PEZI|nr:alpha/beta-hydrolase [Rhizodiscina lignyota]